MTYTVKALQVYNGLPAPGPETYYMSHFDKWYEYAYYIWLIQGGGKTILVDTGFPQDDDDLAILNEACQLVDERHYFYREKMTAPQDALATVGVKPEDIDILMATTLVAYAAGNLELFKNAELYISRKGWLDIVAPVHPHKYKRQVLLTDSTMSYLINEGASRAHLIEDEIEILPDLKYFWVGVHHRGSMAFIANTSKGRVAVSDSAFVFGNIENNHCIGVFENIFEWHDSYARITAESDIWLPIHDPELMTRYPEGNIA
jgi:glyoxylase-like metal-dependent hydrolase (beta-lactamase superfamily II)